MENKKIFIIIIIIAIIAILAGSYFTGALASQSSNESGTVTVLAGAGFSKVGNDLVTEFNKKYPNIKVNIKYGGSGELFSTLETQKSGDIFLPASYKYMKEAKENGYIQNDTEQNLTKNVPVIIVQKGNPKNITGLKDLERSDVKVGLGDPSGPAIGKTSQNIIEKNNLTVNPTVKTTTVNQLLTYVVSGQIDAAIVWEDMTVWQEGKNKIEVVEIPKNENNISTIPVATTKFTKDNSSAQKFQEFITSDEGKKIWEKWGFKMD